VSEDRDGLRLAPGDEAAWWRERGERELRQILFWRWDPIGIQDELPYTTDEYDHYAPRVLEALRRGASPGDIGALLGSFERAEMGLTSRARDAVGELIVKWYGNSRGYWREFDREG
jgi:hypothetical protein